MSSRYADENDASDDNGSGLSKEEWGAVVRFSKVVDKNLDFT